MPVEAIFFTVNLADGIPGALRALAVDAAFRVPLSGIYAAITQALRSAERVSNLFATVTGAPMRNGRVAAGEPFQ